MEESCQQEIKKYFNNKVDVILSDMAVNTTGNKYIDSISTGELSLSAMKFSKEILKSKGIFISKFFMGSAFAPPTYYLGIPIGIAESSNLSLAMIIMIIFWGLFLMLYSFYINKNNLIKYFERTIN